MKQPDRSWRALGLLALAFTACALRFDEGAHEPRAYVSKSALASHAPATDCHRNEAAWFDVCLDHEGVLVAEP